MNLHTIIFDLDGTLYEDPRIFDRYAGNLAASLPPSASAEFTRGWREARERRGALSVGLGYDPVADELFRFAGDLVTHRLSWDGEETAVSEAVPRFAFENFVGDWWQLLMVLATHFGISRVDQDAAFAATRAWMGSDEIQLRQDPDLPQNLATLASKVRQLVAMSNSPEQSVHNVLSELSIADCFDQIVPNASKPDGLAAFLSSLRNPGSVLSVGDHYINDIESALHGGALAVYIDRHETALGSTCDSCLLVPSIPAAWDYLRSL